MQAHFSTDPVKRLGEEMRIAHPGLGCQKDVQRFVGVPAWPRVICPSVSAWLPVPLRVPNGRRGGLGQGRDNACLLAVKDFLAAEINPGRRRHGVRSLPSRLRPAFMAHIGHFMGNNQVVLGVHCGLDIVTDHPAAPSTGRHGPGIRVSEGNLFVGRFL